MSRWAVLLVSLLVFAAGCASRRADTAPPPEIASGSGGATAAAALDGPVDAPDWVPGQWWTWEVTGRDYGTFRVTTVVAQASEDGYVIGATETSPGLIANVFHIPPLGQVDRANLAWQAHAMPVRLLDFPLFDGKTWSGELEGIKLEMEATEFALDGERAFRIDSRLAEFDDQGPRLVYSPTRGLLEVHIHYGGEAPFASAVVVASGGGQSTPVHVLSPRDKFLGGIDGPSPDAELSPVFRVDGEKTYLVFACYLGAQVGRYAATFTPPNQEEPIRCEISNTGSEWASHVRIEHRASINGDWRILFEPVGEGFVEAEVLGILDTPCIPGEQRPSADACSPV